MELRAVNLQYDNSKDIENKRSLWQDRDASFDYTSNGAELIDPVKAEAKKAKERAARDMANAELRDELREAERRIREAEERARELELANIKAEREKKRLEAENAQKEEEARKAKLEAAEAKNTAARSTPMSKPTRPTHTPSYNKSKDTNNYAVAGFVLAFIIPILGFFVSIMGLKKSINEGLPHKGLAIAGIIISIIPIVTFIFTMVLL